MGPAEFLSALFDHGRVRVRALDRPISDGDWLAADAVLAQREAAVRLLFPRTPPDYSPAAARWAANQLYRACQFAVYRDEDAAPIEQAFEEPCPAGFAAAAHYSVDLVLCFLPDLFKFVAAHAADDPLCAQLRSLAEQWPLSSVGMSDIAPRDMDPICAHRALLTCYADRIATREDASRLSDPRVRAACEEAVGDHARLAPSLAAAIGANAPEGGADESAD